MDEQSQNYWGSRRRRAALRLVLGQAQVFGAACTLVLLLREGTSKRVVCIALIIALVSLLSVLLFRVAWKEKSGRSHVTKT